MKRILLTTLVLGSVLVLAPAASAVVLSADSGGGGTLHATVQPAAVTDGWMSSITAPETSTPVVNPATQAVLLRSEGLATQYGVSPATQAVILRSTEVGDYYGSQGVTLRTDILGGDGGASATNGPIATGDDSFAWNFTAIGAASLAGAMLLALGTLAVTRRKHILSF